MEDHCDPHLGSTRSLECVSSLKSIPFVSYGRRLPSTRLVENVMPEPGERSTTQDAPRFAPATWQSLSRSLHTKPDVLPSGSPRFGGIILTSLRPAVLSARPGPIPLRRVGSHHGHNRSANKSAPRRACSPIVSAPGPAHGSVSFLRLRGQANTGRICR